MSSERLELYREYPRPDEADVAMSIVTLMEREMKRNSAPGKTLRDVHSKTHGCVKGFFEIEPSLPEEFRVGVFSQPRRYSAWIRFSNAGGFARVGGTVDDSIRDVRGMAIKLLGVPGAKLLAGQEDAMTQDFLLFTARQFLGASGADFFKLMVAVTGSKLRLNWFLLTNPRMTWVLLRSLQKHDNLLDLEYFSSVPYALGPRAVKYMIRPQVRLPAPPPDRSAPDFLRESLAAQLAQGGVAFDFFLQLQTDPYKMPIEDGLAIWDESLSPYRKVATVTIPKQDFSSPEQMTCCENSSFNPWHCLPEHRPMGGINRVRRIVYKTISDFRHHRNGLPSQEPSGDDPCAPAPISTFEK